MGIHVNIGEAKTRLSSLIQASLDGEEVFIDKAGVPVARLVPANAVQSVADHRARFFGACKGLIPDLDWESSAESEAEWAQILGSDDDLLS